MATGNYFALQPLMIQRLRDAQIPGLGDIMPAKGLHLLLEEGRISDSATYVIYDGESVPTDEGYCAGNRQLLFQQWLVVLATKSYDAPPYGDMDRAGPLLWEINKALQGWRPGPGMEPLKKASSPRTSYLDKFALYPLRFTTMIQTEGAN